MPSSVSLNVPYIVLSGAVIITIVALFTLIQPLLGNISNSRTQLTESEQRLGEKRLFLSTVDTKKTQLQNNRIHEQRLAVILPPEDKYEDALRVFSLAAEESGANISQISDDSGGAQAAINARRARGERSAVPPGVKVIAANVEVTGSYQQLRAFLEKLEKSPRLIDISKIDFTRNQESELLSLSINASMYYAENSTSLTPAPN